MEEADALLRVIGLGVFFVVILFGVLSSSSKRDSNSNSVTKVGRADRVGRSNKIDSVRRK